MISNEPTKYGIFTWIFFYINGEVPDVFLTESRVAPQTTKKWWKDWKTKVSFWDGSWQVLSLI